MTSNWFPGIPTKVYINKTHTHTHTRDKSLLKAWLTGHTSKTNEKTPKWPTEYMLAMLGC